MKPYYNYIQSKKKKNIQEFENTENYTLFRKIIYEMHTDYEFNYRNLSSKIVEKNYSVPKFARISLYFNKIDNCSCREVVSGLMFYRNEDDIFYNDETGLWFSFNKSFEKAVGQECVIDESINPDYEKTILEYLSYHLKLKQIDDDKRNQSISLMLRNNKKYTEVSK